jgi:hypothetical protein
MSKVRILIADDHHGVPEMVKRILASTFEVTLRNRFTRSHRRIAAEVAQVQAKLTSRHPPRAARTIFRGLANTFPVVAFWMLVVILGVACWMFLSSH